METLNVSIVIPVYNQWKITRDCLSDLLKQYGISKEIIIVDDGSKKEQISLFVSKSFPSVKLLTNETNLGFAKTINRGILSAQYENILLLNNDTRLTNPVGIKIMLEALKKYDVVSCAAGKMTKDFQYIPGEATKTTDKFAFLVGWALMVKKEVFNKIGLMPEQFGCFFEDVLFSYRAKKAGFKLGIIENTGIKHLYHTTFKAEGYNITKEYQEKRKIFLKALKEENL